MVCITQMNKTLEYINWVLYPSIDHRQQASFLNLKNWIYSCKGSFILFLKTLLLTPFLLKQELRTSGRILKKFRSFYLTVMEWS